ncbi:helix-turn-helix domain-containing protein [Agromyces laixinhei]|uniref:helix-turn-helix domain-containing protein n=1 Tax=Agromyces laixinhei TaxID=2585717 RepID=UPI0012ECF8D0|nr:XRE family transcriptional regulator [Agromyces laixinhei]
MSENELLNPDTVGGRLRSRRKVLRKTLASVAGRAQISEGFLSQLERDRASASIATLQRICMALEMPVGDLFNEPRQLSVHRHSSANFNPYGVSARKVRITPTTNTQLESFIGEFDAYGTTGDELYAHGDSEETLLIVRGQLEVTIGDETHALGPLDSISYSSSTPHRAREVAGGNATAVWLMSPPSY